MSPPEIFSTHDASLVVAIAEQLRSEGWFAEANFNPAGNYVTVTLDNGQRPMVDLYAAQTLFIDRSHHQVGRFVTEAMAHT